MVWEAAQSWLSSVFDKEWGEGEKEGRSLQRKQPEHASEGKTQQTVRATGGHPASATGGRAPRLMGSQGTNSAQILKGWQVRARADWSVSFSPRGSPTSATATSMTALATASGSWVTSS